MIRIEVLANPNSPGCDETLFSDQEPARPIRGIRAFVHGKDVVCDVIGVDPGPHWVQAHAQKIADSGEGIAFLIFGGAWGIRLRPQDHSHEPWDLKNPHQWGEPYKIYGSKEDLLFA